MNKLTSILMYGLTGTVATAFIFFLQEHEKRRG